MRGFYNDKDGLFQCLQGTLTRVGTELWSVGILLVAHAHATCIGSYGMQIILDPGDDRHVLAHPCKACGTEPPTYSAQHRPYTGLFQVRVDI